MEILESSLLITGWAIIFVGSFWYWNWRKKHKTREGLTRESFLNAFPAGPERQAAAEVHDYLKNILMVRFPLKPDDQLDATYNIRGSDLEGLCYQLFEKRQRTALSPESMRNIHTVGELVRTMARHQTAA